MVDEDVPLLSVRGITKRFAGVTALECVDLAFQAGEVTAVIGENGAGKSTLMKILAGIETPDEGDILLRDRSIELSTPARALQLGISLIHQELVLCEGMDVAANLFLGREPRAFGFLRHGAMRKQATRLLQGIGARFTSTTALAALSVGERQMVEIAKALSTRARVVMMDEPSAALSAHETRKLYELVRNLRSQGVAVVYISHRLGEVRELADRVIVLKDGRVSGTLERHEIDHDRMVNLMVGREFVAAVRQHVEHEPDRAVLLEARRLTTRAHPRHALDFSIRRGEIVGIAGLVGSGRTELLRTLFGIDPATSGKLLLNGRETRLRSPRHAIRQGLALVPEDRKEQGLFLDLAIEENVGLPSLGRRSLLGFVRGKRERALARDAMRSLRIATTDERKHAGSLSGGNQQKVVLAKWLALHPTILLLDEPTRGIDVGARAEIFDRLWQLARDGTTIVFVSSEMEEVLTLPDRVLVMHEGRIQGELERAQLSEENVMQLATGKSLTA
ncbi:MAG: sugar ABC transporter ATP-binding protein [Planctomycetes bacterium]|nr:sugar ABC transporter ATP-binding protein [Planctomycetota bacterium]